MKKIFIATALVLAVGTNVSAQEKTEESIRNYSLYKSLLDVEAYTYAAAPYQIMFTQYPKHSKQIYIDGVPQGTLRSAGSPGLLAPRRPR